jgi:hypothetical protein
MKGCGSPRGYGGERRSPDQVKREGWREQGVLAVAVDDERLTWPERELVRQLGEKLYGKREEAGMAEWTRDMVEERIVEAADVLKQLPGLRPQGYFSTWPEIQRSAKELAQAMPVPMRRPPPSSASISRMEEAITWNRFLERDEANLMWAAPRARPGRSSATGSASAGRRRTGATTTRSA